MKKFMPFESVLPDIRSEGNLLPADMLIHILHRDRGIPGLTEDAYHLIGGVRLTEAINQSWQKMQTVWTNFAAKMSSFPDEKSATGPTRELLLLPLFSELGYGRLNAAKPEERLVQREDGSTVSYPISHLWGSSPIHLLGWGVSLDTKTPGVTGAAKSSPHSMVQDFLNRSDNHLWGFVSNGQQLRILRDNASLSQQAYVQFDLEAIFTSGSFDEFALLWLVCHQSRVESPAGHPETCWLEQWSQQAQKTAVQALESLRSSVRNAIIFLGSGFLQSGNTELHQKLQSGQLDVREYFHQLLRLAYRMIFLFVAEERNLLHPTDAPIAARECYARYYSMGHLRRLAMQIPGGRYCDLFEGIKLVMRSLNKKEGCPQLGLAPLGGFLWSNDALPDLMACRLSNLHLLNAMRALGYTEKTCDIRPIDWEHLGARELGSVYEALLENIPSIRGNLFDLDNKPGNERKTTGSYYTPTPLINSLLDSALEPVLDRAERSAHPETALLGLKICDPACGSGHFLLAAAQRIARHLACLRTGDDEPAPPVMHRALREVIGRCLYGIDINPMSVELCKVSLWMEAMEPGKPLTFLDHHILCGNSLMGTTAKLIMDGIPEDAFYALDGDDKKATSTLKRLNKKQLEAMKDKGSLLAEMYQQLKKELLQSVQPFTPEETPEETLEDLERREADFKAWQQRDAWRRKKFLYDLWTAAFVLRRFYRKEKRYNGCEVKVGQPFGITWGTMLDYAHGQPLPEGLKETVEKVARDYQFFHAEVSFPDVTNRGGFDVILANPPWEHNEIKEQEWFATRNTVIAGATGAKRKQMIANLKTTDPLMYKTFCEAKRTVDGMNHFFYTSGLYPSCGRGRINFYAVFAEWMRRALNDDGLLGCVVPSGIATDDTTKIFFQNMMETKSLISLYDFENRKKIFPAIDSRIKFCLLTTGSGRKPMAERAHFVFFAHSTDEIDDPDKNFSLSPQDIALLNPNTRTCPIFRSTKDAILTKAVYRRIPVLVKEAQTKHPEENPWGITFQQGLFNMTSDSGLFRTRKDLEEKGWKLRGNIFYPTKDVKSENNVHRFLPLYEAKMIHQFNHRWATYDEMKIRDAEPKELASKNFSVLPRYWVSEADVEENLKAMKWKHPWLMGWRDICRATDERTVIFCVLPSTAVGHTSPLILSSNYSKLGLLLVPLSAFVLDFIARQKVGGTHLTYSYLKQLPLLTPKNFDTIVPWKSNSSLANWLFPRILELLYTAEDMRPFAHEMGYDGDPFPWDEKRRFALRAELDAAFFHLYLPAEPDGRWRKAVNESETDYRELTAVFPTPRHAVDYIMETFPIKKKNDLKAYTSYRTKEVILHDYDAMLAAIRSGKDWKSPLL